MSRTAKQSPVPQEIPLRITLVQPPTGVTFCLQRGKSDLIPPTQSGLDSLSFDFTVRVGDPKANGAPNLLGPFTQGTPDDRFVYVNAGTSAGQVGSVWTRRAKIKLSGIAQSMIDTVLATPGAVIGACIQGKAKDGGPACASIPLLGDGWQLVK